MCLVRSSYPVVVVLLLAIQVCQAKKYEPIPGDIFFASVEANNQPGDSTRALGRKIFFKSCYSCHRDTTVMLVPGYSVLKGMTARAVLAAMDNGKMRQQASSLSEKDRQAVAEWITNSKLKSTGTMDNINSSLSVRVRGPHDYSGW